MLADIKKLFFFVETNISKIVIMKASELRIGNYVTDCDGILIYTVARVETIEYADWNDGNDFNVYVLESGTKDRYLEGDFEPIPITEEWLLKFGFEKSVNGWWCPKESLNVKLNENSNIESIEIYLRGSSTDLVSSNFKYVHQLQNLYFILMDEELTFKSK